VQAIDYEGLRAWAERHDSILQLQFRPGDFIVKGDRRVRIYRPLRTPSSVSEEIGRYVVSGDERTPTQDLEFGIRHLVEVAVRALSPGINDPFTATVVIDRLRGTLSRLMTVELPPETLRDRSGRVRVYRQVTTYEGLLDVAVHQIRQAGSAQPAILIHLWRQSRGSPSTRACMSKGGPWPAMLILSGPQGSGMSLSPRIRKHIEQSYRRALQACERAGAVRDPTLPDAR
jgi:uncharacterized membrane protein